MAHFTPKFLEFFRTLAANNHKEWFDQNKKWYEKEVKKPFEAFVGDLIREMRKDDPSLLIEPREAIFRINRDIRFSPDKTPYKTQVSALISRGGRKDHTTPGLYIELGPEHTGIYGGLYFLDTASLLRVRTYFANHTGAVKKALGDKGFADKFGGLRGEEQKRIPKEFKDAAEELPLLMKKQYYYTAQLPAETALENNLLEKVMEYHRSAAGVRDVLFKALNS